MVNRILHRCLHRLSSVAQTPDLMAATIAISPGRRVYQLQQPCVMNHRSLHRLQYQSPSMSWTKRYQSSMTGVAAVGEVTTTAHTGRKPAEPSPTPPEKNAVALGSKAVECPERVEKTGQNEDLGRHASNAKAHPESHLININDISTTKVVAPRVKKERSTYPDTTIREPMSPISRCARPRRECGHGPRLASYSAVS